MSVIIYFKKALLGFMKMVAVVLLFFAVLCTYPIITYKIAVSKSENFCALFPIGSKITLKELINKTDGKPELTIATGENDLWWTAQKDTIPEMNTFFFTTGWRGAFLDKFVCNINVQDGSVIGVETKLLD